MNANQKILVVDDERDIVDLISYSLTKEGYQVYQAYNGKEGIEIAKQANPDLIILDVILCQSLSKHSWSFLPPGAKNILR
jgi:two-component system alkaline phosphatase synthesis response regulator PhoP